MTTYIDQDFLPKNQTVVKDGFLNPSVTNNSFVCTDPPVPALIPKTSIQSDAFKNCFFDPLCEYSRYFMNPMSTSDTLGVYPTKENRTWCVEGAVGANNHAGTWVSSNKTLDIGGQTISYKDKIGACNDAAGYNLSTRNAGIKNYCVTECAKSENVGKCDTFIRSFCDQNPSHPSCPKISNTTIIIIVVIIVVILIIIIGLIWFFTKKKSRY